MRSGQIRFVMSMVALTCSLMFSDHARADQHYSREVVFENSLSAGFYPYSHGHVSAPSALELVGGKLPVETTEYVSGPNALKLAWTSAANGDWDAQLLTYRFRNRDFDWDGDSLFLWLWSEEGIRANKLPRLAMTNLQHGHTESQPLGQWAKDIAPKTWTRVRVPLKEWKSTSLEAFNPRKLFAIVLSQAGADGKAHTLYLDDIRVGHEDDGRALQKTPTAPTALRAKGYERHIDLQWTAQTDSSVAQYVVYRSLNGGAWKAIGVQRYGVNRYEDFLGDPHATAAYKISARTSTLTESAKSNEASAMTHLMTDDELLTMVQEASFRYYWDTAEPVSGLARESQPGADDIIATGASGFGIMAMVVAVDRGFITRDQGVDRMLQITKFLERADRYHGAWAHFISGQTGHTVALFQIYDNGADLVETSFLMQGLLAARGYYTKDNAKEREIRERITRMWEAVDWDWFRATPQRDALWWHWSPDYGFHIANRLEGWNEVMITYLLAEASPTHPIPASVYYTGYAREGVKEGAYGLKTTYYGINLEQNYFPKTETSPGTPGPLFFTHYSYLGYDPRGVRDKYTNYFRNNRNESLVSEEYSEANPSKFVGYGSASWGLTAVDGPDDRYHEYKPFLEDEGTIAPTGAVSAYAYTPQESIAAIKHWYRDLGAQLWDVYGFRDSFNETENWYSGIYMGLNQGPQTVMIENGRTGLVWKAFMSNPEMRPMQKKIGLVPDKD